MRKKLRHPHESTNAPPGRMNVADYVLSLPKKEAAEDFEHACDLASQATLYLIEHGLEKTQQKFN